MERIVSLIGYFISFGFLIFILAIGVFIYKYRETPLLKQVLILSGFISMLLLYLFIFLGDPGLAVLNKRYLFTKVEDEEMGDDSFNDTTDIIEQPQSLQNTNTYICRTCFITVSDGNRPVHCRECNTCVIGYDHHCAVFSKCIAYKNLMAFRTLIGGVMLLTLFSYSEAFAMLKIKTN